MIIEITFDPASRSKTAANMGILEKRTTCVQVLAVCQNGTETTLETGKMIAPFDGVETIESTFIVMNANQKTQVVESTIMFSMKDMENQNDYWFEYPVTVEEIGRFPYLPKKNEIPK